MRIKVIVSAFAGNLTPKQIKEIIKMTSDNSNFPAEIRKFHSDFYIKERINEVYHKVKDEEHFFCESKIAYASIFSHLYRKFIADIILYVEKEYEPKPYHAFYSASQEQVIRSMTMKVIGDDGKMRLRNLEPFKYYNAEGNEVIISEANEEKKTAGKWNDYVYRGIVYNMPPKLRKAFNKYVSVEVYKKIITDHPNFNKKIIEFIMNS